MLKDKNECRYTVATLSWRIANKKAAAAFGNLYLAGTVRVRTLATCKKIMGGGMEEERVLGDPLPHYGFDIEVRQR